MRGGRRLLASVFEDRRANSSHAGNLIEVAIEFKNFELMGNRRRTDPKIIRIDGGSGTRQRG